MPGTSGLAAMNGALEIMVPILARGAGALADQCRVAWCDRYALV